MVVKVHENVAVELLKSSKDLNQRLLAQSALVATASTPRETNKGVLKQSSLVSTSATETPIDCLLLKDTLIFVHLSKPAQSARLWVATHNDILTTLCAGAMAGAVAKSVIAPLDRTKIHFQISTDRRYSLRGAVKFLLCSLRNEGVVALWRGNSATMARIIPYAAIQYAAHEQWKHALNPTNQRNLPPLRRYLAGSLAGVTASSLTYPLDFARARMAVTKKCEYNTLIEVFVKIHRTEGLHTVFRGFTSALAGIIPYAGTCFYTYETLKKWHADYTGDVEPSHMSKICFGAVAGLLGQSTSYPLDIIRRRMQTSGVTGMSHVYTSIGATLMYVYRTEGVRRGLFKGLSMNWIKGPICVGISFTTFEFCQRHLRQKSKTESSTIMTSSVTSSQQQSGDVTESDMKGLTLRRRVLDKS